MSKIEKLPEPKNRFLSFLSIGLSNADNGLGDRSKYVGSSDIGGCLKRAVLSKIKGEQKRSLDERLILERGHIVEGIIEKALKSNSLSYKSQVGVKALLDDETPVEAHLDFVVENNREAVVIECKSVSHQIDAPYESWVLQIQFQLGLLKASFQRKGLNKPVRGIIAVMDVNTGWAKEFHIADNETLLAIALNRAKTIWNAVKGSQSEAKDENANAIDGELGALCGYCPFKGQCQTLRSGATELPDQIAAKVNRLKELSKTEKEMKSLKAEIKSYLEAATIKKATAGSIAIAIVPCKGKPSIDTDKLKELVGEDVVSECVSESDGYSYLRVA
jgi:CRISPR-associated exonuclease Cas4